MYIQSLYRCDLQKVNVWPVGDVFDVADGVVYPPFFSTQNDPVEVSVHHSGTETFEFRNQPDSGMREWLLKENDTVAVMHV